jgi:hypothetical protein
MPIIYGKYPSSGAVEQAEHIDFLLYEKTGEDGRDLFAEAVWWRQTQLNQIEAEWRSALSA